MAAPVDPTGYSDKYNPVWTDEALEENGWASGLAVWGTVNKIYADALSDGSLANGQLWSLRRAVRRELLEELGLDVSRA